MIAANAYLKGARTVNRHAVGDGQLAAGQPNGAVQFRGKPDDIRPGVSVGGKNRRP